MGNPVPVTPYSLPASLSKRYFLLVLAALTLAGCGLRPLSPEYVPGQGLEPGSGALVGSFSRDPREYEYYSQTFYYEGKSNKKKYKIGSLGPIPFTATKDDFKPDDSRGFVFAYRLPKGTYHFTDFYLAQPTGGSSYMAWRSREPYSIPFEIAPGKVNYVGEIKVIPVMGKNIFGITIPAGGFWVVSDQRVRDIELLKKKYPDLNWESVNIIVPDREDTPAPLVFLPSELGAAK